MCARIVAIEPWVPSQAQFVFSNARLTAFIGGIGAGKTRGGAIKATRWLAEWRERGTPSVGMVVAPTYRMLADVAVRTYHDVLQIPPGAFNKSDFTCRLGKNEILFRSADNPDSLRGPNIHWCHLDEAALCAPQTFDILLGRLRADGMAGPLWITTTPKGRNWVYDRVADGTLTVFRARTADNPHLAPGFVADLYRAYSDQFARQELEAEFVTFEGLVYSGFRRDVHVRHIDTTGLEWFVIGCDEGYTNPSVALVVGFDGDGRAYIVEEFYRRNVLQATFVAEVARLAGRYRVEFVFVDPSAAGLIAALVDAGVNAYPAPRVSVLDGIRAVSSRLEAAGDGQPRLTLSPACPQTIAEFESYIWCRDAAGNLVDRPEKQNDHAMDALRYALMGVEERHGETVLI